MHFLINVLCEMLGMGIVMKEIIRSSTLELRNSLSQEQVNDWSRTISDMLISSEAYKASKCIFTYVNFGNEVRTDFIIQHALNNGKRVFIPVCNARLKEIVTMEIKSLSNLEKNYYGILEPTQASIHIVDRSLIDTAIVPGIAFDRSGNRLGFGAGYYDKFFSSLNKEIHKLALAFSIQLVDNLKAEPHDVPVDAIITEREYIYCKA